MGPGKHLIPTHNFVVAFDMLFIWKNIIIIKNMHEWTSKFTYNEQVKAYG